MSKPPGAISYICIGKAITGGVSNVIGALLSGEGQRGLMDVENDDTGSAEDAGNVNPLEVAVRGTPEEVREETLAVLETYGDEGMIPSVDGGVNPGMPRENIRAIIDA